MPGPFGERTEPEAERPQRQRADHDQEGVVGPVRVRDRAVEVEGCDRDDHGERERDLEQRPDRLRVSRGDEFAARAQ